MRPHGLTERGGRAAAALRGAVLAALVYVSFDELYVWRLGALRFLPWLWAAVAVGLVLGAFGGKLGMRLLWGAAAAAAVLLLVVGTTPLARPLALGIIRRDLVPGAPLPADVDAVAVLSSGLRDNGLVAEEGLDRLIDALRLARASGRPLVVSVVHSASNPEVTSLADQRDLANLAGVSRLYAVDSVGTTHDEATRMAALARREGWRRVALVTSPLHSRRACAVFEHAGVSLVCVPARPRELVLDGPRPLPPGEQRYVAFGEWMYETLGWWSYRARGWI